MTCVAIVYFSQYRGHTRVLADAIQRGAETVPDVQVVSIPVDKVEQHWDDLHQADAIIFGTPTYVGSIAAKFKEFIEKLAGEVWLKRVWTGKVAGGFTVSAGQSGDKLNCLQQLVVFAAQMGMIWVSLPVLGGKYSTKGGDEDINRLGGYLGVMAQANIDERPETAPPPSDRKTAEIYGAHIAGVARELKEGRRVLGAEESIRFVGRPKNLPETFDQ
ncbi:MAG: flavodoxin family protein [Rhodospirillaceae bacterium]|jgi:NAD(P)H dehydrogenase (quinone)|nr:flavodoxin family protein [Rhodospirillaceae bacterium]MBT5564291.1 flavodoxin family protein [Rhodospirillaceae bacterium]MBT6088855.1 flavodoxin family protein [Rhodospirillaceae bacterium]MBT6960113.1 flavodoxin family protein [Rhodospirillaceae bacterium]MBT7451801.1 flavodoxin family protein [Rhodospirillaceae bacterium]